MSDLKWKVSDLKWKVSYLVWKVSDLKWKMSDLKWKMSDLKWKVSDVIWKVSLLKWKWYNKSCVVRINCKVRIVQRVIGRNTQRVSKHVETCQNVSKYTACHYVLSS